MSEQLQNTGVGYWACRACSAYAANMNRRMKQIEDKMERYDKELDTAKAALQRVDKKVEEISVEMKKKEEKTENMVKQGEQSVYEEMRERETRRLNVVLFGIPELNEKDATGKDKLEWDKKSCCNVFDALNLGLGDKSIKFCRRVGEKGDKHRPLVIGFWSESERASLMREARNLEKTMFNDISVAPDLTKIQREEEKEMKKEAERRNTQLSEDDRSKNLQWLVVGARGEKRFVKSVPRDPPPQGRTATRGRGMRGTGVRGAGASRGTRGKTSGANSIPITGRPAPEPVRRGSKEKETEEEADTETETESEMETETETETMGEADSGASKTPFRRKRKGSGGRAVDAPPEKR